MPVTLRKEHLRKIIEKNSNIGLSSKNGVIIPATHYQEVGNIA